MKRVAAGALLPTPWLFEPAIRPDDAADYCSVLSQWKHRILVFTLEWSVEWSGRFRVYYLLSGSENLYIPFSLKLRY